MEIASTEGSHTLGKYINKEKSNYWNTAQSARDYSDEIRTIGLLLQNKTKTLKPKQQSVSELDGIERPPEPMKRFFRFIEHYHGHVWIGLLAFCLMVIFSIVMLTDHAGKYGYSRQIFPPYDHEYHELSHSVRIMSGLVFFEFTR